jgi:hypothetical protein
VVIFEKEAAGFLLNFYDGVYLIQAKQRVINFGLLKDGLSFHQLLLDKLQVLLG